MSPGRSRPDPLRPDPLRRDPLRPEPTRPDPFRPEPADLFAAWAARVRANREQVERVREIEDPPDFYGPVSSVFRADPRRTDEAALAGLLELVVPGETWLDIGAGAGRYALPLALALGEGGRVVAVEPSAGMAAGLREGMAEHGIGNVTVLEGGWPPDAPTTGRSLAASAVPPADVALIAHVSYDIEPFEAFLGALEVAARRRCVAILMERQPASVADPFWPVVHGEERIALPALRELVALLLGLGRRFDLRTYDAPRRGWSDRDEAVGFLRRQLWLAPGGEKEAILLREVDRRLELVDGRWTVRGVPGHQVGLLAWEPRSSR